MRGASHAAARSASCAHECSSPMNASTPMSLIRVICVIASADSGRPVSDRVKHRLYPGNKSGSLCVCETRHVVIDISSKLNDRHILVDCLNGQRNSSCDEQRDASVNRFEWSQVAIEDVIFDTFVPSWTHVLEIRQVDRLLGKRTARWCMMKCSLTILNDSTLVCDCNRSD